MKRKQKENRAKKNDVTLVKNLDRPIDVCPKPSYFGDARVNSSQYAKSHVLHY